MAIKIEQGVYMSETRGRPPCDEHMTLLTMPVDSSFVSSKRRETLYQLARDMAIKVRILETEKGSGVWRVWKLSRPGERIPPRSKKALKAEV